MRAAALFSAVVWATASAQTILPPERGAELFSRGGPGVLKCEVRQLPPVLDFSFRFRAGYTVAVPLSQFQGPGHRWTMMVRLQSAAAGQPVYFVDRVRLPSVPNTKMYGEAGGGYLLGEGSYRASFLLRDDQSRACRADWNIEARLGTAGCHVTLAIDPGTAEEVSLRGRRPVSSPGDAPLGRLTVLLHAAPASPRRSTIQASDAVTLLGALSSLLDLAPADSVRLVVFNLDRQKEIYREERFTPDKLETVRQAMFDLQLGVVDYQTLQHPEGRVDLLAGLVNRELEAENRSDAVVFLGPRGHLADKRASEIWNRGAGGPKFFYVEYERPVAFAAGLGRSSGRSGRASSLHDVPNDIAPRSNADIRRPDEMGWASDTPFLTDPVHDTIEYLVAGLKGKTLVVRTPDEFAKAMKQIARGK